MSLELLKRWVLEEGMEDVPLPFPKSTYSKTDYKEYEMEVGVCRSWKLYVEKNNFGVHKWFNTKGTVFPEHNHAEDNCTEVIVCCSGKMVIHKSASNIVLQRGDPPVYNLPQEKHSAEFLEDTTYLTIMIPPSKDYPNGK